MGGNRPAAKVVAIGKAARHDDEIDLRDLAVAMPDHVGWMAHDGAERLGHVLLAVRSGKDDDGGLHVQDSPAALAAAVRTGVNAATSIDQVDGVVLDHRVGEKL